LIGFFQSGDIIRMSHEISHNGGHDTSQSTFDNTGKLAAILIGVTAAVAGLLMYHFNPFLNSAASLQGTYIDNLFGVATGFGTVVFVMVQGLLLYSIIRFHRQSDDDDDGPPIRGNTKLEIVWTVIPALVIIFLGILSYQVLVAAERPASDELVVEVRGMQFAWQFYYPDYDITTTELHLPVDRQAHLKLRSNDVIHSFWVPAFRIKKDLLPDRVTETFITPIEEGTYPIVCAELCGAAHAQMRSQVVVESDSSFKQWVSGQGVAVAGGAGSEGAAVDPMTKGRQVFNQNGCNACHALADAGATGQIGPALNTIGTVAGEMVPGQSPEDYIHTAIVNPNEYVVEGYPANVMPSNYGTTISEADLNALVDYLMAQK
jgi:cytochrome c oxidase subunit 2